MVWCVSLYITFSGVFTTTIDPQQQKVTVTGNVGVEILIKKLAKAGKYAEVLPENLSGKEKDSNKGKKNKKSEQRDQETVKKQNHSSAKNRGIENAEKCKGENKSSNNTKKGDGSPEKSPAGGKLPETGNVGGGGDSGKKKKMKKAESGGGSGTVTGSNGLSLGCTGAPAHSGSEYQYPGQVVGQVNLSPTRQQSYMYPETCYPPLVQYATYNRLCPMGTMGGPSYYVPPLPYMCAGFDRDPYQFQSTPLIPFEIFSDENANGCFVM